LVEWVDVEWLCEDDEWWVDVACFLVFLDFDLDLVFDVGFFFAGGLGDLGLPELPDPDGSPGLVPCVVGVVDGGVVGVDGVDGVVGVVGVVGVDGVGSVGGVVDVVGVDVVSVGGGVVSVGAGVVAVVVLVVPEVASVAGVVSVGAGVVAVVVGVVAADAVEAAVSEPITVSPAASAMAWRRTYRARDGAVVRRNRRATSAWLRTGSPSATAGRPSAVNENSARGNSTISIGTSKLARHRTGATACRPAGRPRRTPPDASWLVRTPARSTIRWAPAGVPTAASSRPATSSTAALSLSGA
jgi:hypothetical protein